MVVDVVGRPLALALGRRVDSSQPCVSRALQGGTTPRPDAGLRAAPLCARCSSPDREPASSRHVDRRGAGAAWRAAYDRWLSARDVVYSFGHRTDQAGLRPTAAGASQLWRWLSQQVSAAPGADGGGGASDRDPPDTRGCRAVHLEAVSQGHTKRLLRTDPLRAMVVGAFVRGLSVRDVESLW